MNCSDIESLIPQYANNRLAQAEINDINKHLVVCPDCRKVLEDYQFLFSKSQQADETPEKLDLVSNTMKKIKEISKVDSADGIKTPPKLTERIGLRRFIPRRLDRKVGLIGILALALVVSLAVTIPPFFRQDDKALAAEIVGHWEANEYISEYISVITAGEINGIPYLFVGTVQGGMPYESTLRVLDIRDPKNPIEVGSLKAPVNGILPISDFYLSESILYANLSGEGVGVWVIDVSDPALPKEITLISTEYPVMSMALSGQYLYVIGVFERVISVFDVSDPEQPKEIGALKTGGGNLKIFESFLYVVADDGLHIIDISTPSSPQDIGFYADPTGVERGFVEEIPTSPIPVIDPSNKLADRFFDVAVSGQYAYLASGNNGLSVLDISDPASPIELTQLDIPGSATGVLVSGNIVYLLSIELIIGEPIGGSLMMIDITDPSIPKVVYSLDTKPTNLTPPSARLGNNIFIVYSYSGLLVIEVSGT